MEHVPSYEIRKASWRDTLESLRSNEVVFDEDPFTHLDIASNSQEFTNSDIDNFFFGKEQARQLEDDFKFDWNELEEQKAKHVKFVLPKDNDDGNILVENEQSHGEEFTLDTDQNSTSPAVSETDSVERKLQHDFNNNYVSDIVLTLNQLKFVRERLNTLIFKVDSATVLQQTENAEPAFLTTEVENVKKSLISLLN